MKTGIVMEVGNGSAVVMLSGGQFQKVEPRAGWEVGKVVALSAEKKRVPVRRAVLLAAACMAFVVTTVLVGYQFLFRTVSVIGLDINPSISLEMNRLDKVTAVKGLNDDGTSLVQGRWLGGMDYVDALSTLLMDEALTPYLENGQYLVFSLYSDKDPGNLQTSIEQVLEKVHSQHGHLEINLLNVDRDDMDEAQQYGVSPAKLLMVRQLAQLDPSASPEALVSQKIGDLYGAIVSSGEAVQGSNGSGTVIEKGKPGNTPGNPGSPSAGGDNTSGGNNGNNTGGNSPDSNNGNNIGGNSPDSNNGNNTGGNSPDSNNGNNTGGNSPDSNNGNNTGGNSPDSNNGNNTGGNSPDSNNGNNTGGNSPDSNNGNNTGGNSPDSNNGNNTGGNDPSSNNGNSNSNNGNSNNGNSSSNNGNTNKGNSNSNKNSNNGKGNSSTSESS